MSDIQTMPFYKTSSFLYFTAISGSILIVSLMFSDLSLLEALSVIFLYAVSNRWIYCFIFGRRMYMPTIGSELKRGEHDGYRFLLFAMGVVLALVLLLSINGVFKHA